MNSSELKKEGKVYVAGHRGLVGSAIVKVLKQKGYQNLILKTHEQLELTDQVAVAQFFAQEKPEYVFLAAAKVGGIFANNRYRAQFIYENLQIQNNIIHQSYIHGVKKLLFLGSTCIYPKHAPQPLKEEYLLTAPLEYTNEPYAIAKIAGLKMCENYNIQYGTHFLSVMPTNLYGFNDNFDLEFSHVLPALIRKMHLGKALEENNWDVIHGDLKRRPLASIKPNATQKEILQGLKMYGISTKNSDNASDVKIELWGSGTPLREFLHADDMADACVYLMESVNFNNQSATHINIGSGENIAISDLANLIKEIVGYQGKFYYNTDKPDGTKIKAVDSSKLHNLGWKHQTNLRTGIKLIYDWYRCSSLQR